MQSTARYLSQSSEKDVRRSHIRRQRRAVRAQSGVSDQIIDIAEVDKVTTFIDSVEPITVHPESTSDAIFNSVPRPDLAMFLSRPYNVGTYIWPASATIGTNVFTIVFPDVLFAITNLQNKLASMAFMRPDIEISVRVNGTLMHYGRLVFCWIPQAVLMNATYKNYKNAFSNKWFQVSANSQQVTKIKIPYTSYKNYINIGLNSTDLFTLYGYVSVPLNSVNGTASPVNVTVFAQIIEPRVAGYVYRNDYTAQSGELEEANQSKTLVSRVTKKAGELAKCFTQLPYIGTYAATISSGLFSVSSMFQALGLSVPMNIQHIQPMQVRQPRWNQVSDTPHSLSLGPRPDSEVTKDFGLVNDTEECLDMLHFVSRPSLLYTGQIASSDAPGTIDFNQWITPILMNCTDYSAGFTSAGYVGLPMQFMARYALYWRGGIKFHFSFVCSRFHSLRVRIFYLPYYSNNANVFPTPTEIQTNDTLNYVVDIETEKEVSFTIPYMQLYEWSQITSGFVVASSNETNGYLGLQLINSLTAGASTVSPLFYQVFVAAANDFQLGTPSMQYDYAHGHFLAQSGVADCEFPSASYECLMKLDYPTLGGIKGGHVCHSTHSILPITGVRQLANMMSPLVTVTANTSLSGYSINIGAPINYRAGDARIYNYLINMLTVFRYFRGGVRLAFATITPQAIVQLYTALTSVVTDMITIYVGVDVNFYGNDLTFGFANFVRTDLMPFDVTIPHNLHHNCRVTQINPVFPLNQSTISANIGIISSNGGMLGMAAGDDLIFGYQLGIPIASV